MHSEADFVVIVDYKGNVTGNTSALRRHQLYGKTLSSVTHGETKLLILGIGRNKSLLREIPELEVISLPISSKFTLMFIAFSVKALWSRRRKIRMIVSGDPWFTLVVVKLIRYLLQVKIGLQVQLHGDFLSSNWKSLRPQNHLASLCLPTLLKNCESIRVVNSAQVQDLVNVCKVEFNRVACVPLPLNIPKIPNHNLRAEGLPIAFVGRIEEERGLKNLLRLVESNSEIFAARSLWISGGGSKRAELERELKKYLPVNSIVFMGELDPDQLVNMWTRVGVLLSLAPAESYGLAMREAIVNGIPVLAVKSVGSISLEQSLKGDGLLILKEPFETRRVAEQFSTLDKMQISESTREALFSESSNFVEILCSSWLKTSV